MPELDTPRYQTRIMDMPEQERPRERLRDYGASNLNNAELLAILLRTGSSAGSALSLANRMLADFRELSGLAKASFSEMLAFHGLGEAKAAQVMAALELGKRLSTLPADERPTIREPRDVVNLLSSEMSFLDQESPRVLLLNTKNQVVRVVEVYKGNVNSINVMAGETLRPAVRENCPKVILVHNHPSGDPAPSNEDVQMTTQLIEAGKLLDVEVMDHVVIARGGFVSLKAQQLAFP